METPVLARCRLCGYEWSANPRALLAGRGCPKCAGKRKTSKEFATQISEINPDVILLDEYTNTKIKMHVKYRSCGHEMRVFPSSLLNGNGCTKCLGRYKTTDEFVEKLKANNEKVEVIGEYKRMAHPILVRCIKCGTEWMADPKRLLAGNGCSKCYGTPRKERDKYVSELKLLNPSLEVLEPYVRASEKILHKCNQCGYEWKATPNSLLRKSTCPNCNAGFQSSFFEQFLYFSMCATFGEENVHNRVKDLIGKEIDIYIPKINAAIEYGSWYWHKNKVKSDYDKYIRCREKGITLLTIYDYRKSATEEDDNLFEGNILLIQEELGEERNNIELLDRTLKLVYDALNIPYVFTHKEIKKLRRTAELACRRRTTEDFVVELEKINPNVIIVGEYTYSHSPINAECKVCGHIWSPTPHTLLRGSGCPKCAGAGLKKTTEEFEKELQVKNSNLEVVGEYTGSENPIEIRCKVCKHQWVPVACRVIEKPNCPKCTPGRKGTTRDTKVYGRSSPKTWTTETYREAVKKILPNIEIKGEYVGYQSRIAVLCEVCGYEWKPLAGNLLRGHGCAKCNGSAKKNTNVFKDELEAINPNLEVLGEYVHAKHPIRVKCKICQHEWNPDPSRLLRGHGCPRCSGNFVDTEEFKRKVALKNPSIEMVGEYNGVHTPVLVRCRECGYEWLAAPATIYRSSSCVNCHTESSIKR